MRPKLITPGKVILALIAVAIFATLISWLRFGSRLPWSSVPSTAGKIAFVREQEGASDIYMIDGATGGSEVALTNDKKGNDNEPSWSSDGENIALTSDRVGISRQIYLMNAQPGAKVANFTNTSTTKELPRYEPDQDVYFLDSGRIAKVSATSAETDVIFPTADQMRGALRPTLFYAGAINQFSVAPDMSRYFASVKLERGEALVAWLPNEKVVAAFGVAKKILFSYMPDGSVIALFVGGESFPAPGQLPTAPINSPDEANAYLPIPPPGQTVVNALVRIDPELHIEKVDLEKMPDNGYVPNNMTVSLDGAHIALTSSEGKDKGIFVFNVTDTSSGTKITSLPAAEPTFSPDGSMLAFASKNDIYSIPTSGGTPKNLTNGKGINFAPTWSPAKKK